MRVICAGFGRTGTASLKSALETLLDGPCYHFEELFKHAEQRKTWSRFVRGEADMDWEALYADYAAAVDFPSCAYYQEIATAFPDALVILSLRDLESWAKSWQSLWRFLPYFQSRLLRRLFPWVDEIADVLAKVIEERTFGGAMDPASIIATHEAHIARVKEVIPAERLLVFRVQDGWAPLCEALDVPVPDGPFPHSNSGSWPFIRRAVRKMFGRRWVNLDEG
jgi:hypothetical protein